MLKQRPIAKQKQNASVMSLAEINAMMSYGQTNSPVQEGHTSVISIPNNFVDSRLEIEVPASKSKPVKKAPKTKVAKKVEWEESDDEEEVYHKESSKRRPTSHSRQDASLILNELFEDVIDSCIKKDVHRIFFQKVTKKIAPDYFKFIKNPIDLTLMKNKAKRGEYKDQADLVADFSLLRFNAETYNGTEHEVSIRAREIEEHALMQL
jgi:hypothetical protein